MTTSGRNALCNAIVTCNTAHNILQTPGASLAQGDLNCAPLVLSQLNVSACEPASADASSQDNAARWMLPEPWNGRLESAGLLFIGQNPSADFAECYPTLGQHRKGTPADVLEYFESRFDGVAIKGGTQVRMKDDSYGPANPFLAQTLGVARLLYGDDVVPGRDYALTEGVRCKSKAAIGVHLAVDACAQRYMRETLALSGARVIVCLGAIARRALLVACARGSAVGAAEKKYKSGTIAPMADISGIESDKRQILFLNHPNVRMGDGPEAQVQNLAAEQLNDLRALLKWMAQA